MTQIALDRNVSDVVITSPENGASLVYNTSTGKWEDAKILASNVTTSTGSFNTILTSGDITVQMALDRLDDHGAVVSGVHGLGIASGKNLITMDTITLSAPSPVTLIIPATGKAALMSYTNTGYFRIDNSIASNVVFQVRAHASQSADIMRIYDSAALSYYYWTADKRQYFTDGTYTQQNRVYLGDFYQYHTGGGVLIQTALGETYNIYNSAWGLGIQVNGTTGHVGIGATAASDSQLYVYHNITDTSGLIYGGSYSVQLNPGADSTTTIVGLYLSAFAAGAYTFSGNITGASLYTWLDSAGTFSGTLSGADIFASNTEGRAATIATLIGCNMAANARSSAVSTAMSSRVYYPVFTSGSIVTGYGIRFYENLAVYGAGSMTTLYAMYFDKMTKAGTNYLIYAYNGISVFNVDKGSQADLIYHGDTLDNLLYIDVSADAIGVGTSTPTLRFSINEEGGLTPDGGFAIKVTAGENLSRGEVVQITQGVAGGNDRVFKNAIDGDMPVGVVYADATISGYVWVVTNGIAYVLPEAGYTAARGYVIYSSDATAGRVDQSASLPSVTLHNREIGHWLDDGAGNGLITRAVIHFN